MSTPDACLLAFDYGLRKIGVALGNTVTRQAQPLTILRQPTRTARFAAIDALLQQWQPARVVVGLPLTLDGEEQYASNHCRRFANQLRGRFGVAVELVDERGTSVQAQSLMDGLRKKQREKHQNDDDALAAMLILERYFSTLP